MKLHDWKLSFMEVFGGPCVEMHWDCDYCGSVKFTHSTHRIGTHGAQAFAPKQSDCELALIEKIMES